MRNRNWTKTGICSGCDDYKNRNGGAMHLWDIKHDYIKVCLSSKLKLDYVYE